MIMNSKYLHSTHDFVNRREIPFELTESKD